MPGGRFALGARTEYPADISVYYIRSILSRQKDQACSADLAVVNCGLNRAAFNIACRKTCSLEYAAQASLTKFLRRESLPIE